MEDEATAVVLRLDMAHLTELEKDWLHDLLHRVQVRMLEARAKSK